MDNTNNSNTVTVNISEVAGSAYTEAQLEAGEFLTHAAVTSERDIRVLCKRVKVSSLLLDIGSDLARDATEPTCETCKRNLDKLRATATVIIENVR